MTELIGLLTKKRTAIPLVGVTVKGDILGRGAKVQVLQRFRNSEDHAVEAVYRFPLPEGAAVCGFKATIDGRIIKGQVEEREKAFEMYDDALMRGDGGNILDQERPNIFTLSVGNLNPGSEADIEIEYVTLLDMEGPKVRFVLPTTISPRYIPAHMPERDGIPEDRRIHPEYAAEVPYGLSLSLNIHNGRALKSIDSPSHHIQLQMGTDITTVTFSSETVRMDRDFVLKIEHVDSQSASKAYLYTVGEETFVQLDLFLDEEEDNAKSNFPPATQKKEIIFVLDCSGSMQGDSIREAKKALEICLRGLQDGASFNIYRFGSRFESLFKKSKLYSDKTLQEGLKYLQKTDANLGGTEILSPLRDIFSKHPTKEAERNIILLTDGEVGNEEEIHALVAENKSSSRMFTLGIGPGPNEYFIKGAAQVGRGGSEFIYPGERIEPKVLRIFQNLLKNGVEDVKIVWGDENVEQAPESSAIFLGTPTTLFARARANNQIGDKIAIKGRVNGQGREWKIEWVDTDSQNLPIPTLWAKERIRDLEALERGILRKGSRQRRRKGKQLGASIIDLSKKYGLLSSATSFVAIEEREEKDKTTGEVVLRKVPSLVTIGWHGMGNVFGISGLMADRAVDYEELTLTCEIAPSRSARIQHTQFLKMPCYPSAGESAEKSPNNMDILLSILSLQNVKGDLKLDDKIARTLGIDLRQLHKLAKGMKVQVELNRFLLLSTAILLQVLENHFATERSTWEGVVQKSRIWLDKMLKKAKPTIENQDLIMWVRQFVVENIRLSIS